MNVGSVLSAVVAMRNGIYCASKFALMALSDTLRIELHGTGIEVISVLPAYTDTPFFDNMYRYGTRPGHESVPRAASLQSGRRHPVRLRAAQTSGRVDVFRGSPSGCAVSPRACSISSCAKRRQRALKAGLENLIARVVVKAEEHRSSLVCPPR